MWISATTVIGIISVAVAVIIVIAFVILVAFVVVSAAACIGITANVRAGFATSTLGFEVTEASPATPIGQPLPQSHALQSIHAAMCSQQRPLPLSQRRVKVSWVDARWQACGWIKRRCGAGDDAAARREGLPAAHAPQHDGLQAILLRNRQLLR